MATKRKRTVAKKPSRKASKAVFKPSRPSFNKRTAIIVALLFGAVGVYFLVKSLAANGILLVYTDFVSGASSPGSVVLQETGTSKHNTQVVEITSGATSKALYRSTTKGLVAGSYKTCINARSLGSTASGAITISSLNGGTLKTLATRNYSLAPMADYQSTGCVNFNLATATTGEQVVITDASGGKLRVGSVSFEKTSDPILPTDCSSDSNSNFTPAGMRPITCALYGVTVDRVDGLSSIIASSNAFQKMPTTRIVFDGTAQVSDYNTAINQMQPDSYLMGELRDSYEENDTKVTVASEQTRTTNYLNAYSSKIDIWEIGNEVNGNWTGPYSGVANKLVARYNIVKSAGKRTALTLWENTYAPDHCGNGTSELTGVQFSNQYVPENVRNGLNYVLLSWYPSQCGGLGSDNVPAATIKAEIEQLHTLYPNALIGFGEIGMPHKAVTDKADNTSRLQAMVDYYYGLSPQINLPYYTGGYFYWYYWEDALPYTSKPIWQNLNNGFGKY